MSVYEYVRVCERVRVCVAACESVSVYECMGECVGERMLVCVSGECV